MTDSELQSGQPNPETARRGSQTREAGLPITGVSSLSDAQADATAEGWKPKTARRGSRLEIKTVDTARRREVNISEWNADVKAYVRDLTGLERMTFADQLDQFLDKKLSVNERLEAALCACVMALVDEEGNALFALDQIETLKQASFSPVSRVLNLLTDVTSEDQSLKKG